MKNIIILTFLLIFSISGNAQTISDSSEMEEIPNPWRGLLLDFGFSGVNESGNYYQSFPKLKTLGSRTFNIYYYFGLRISDKFTLAPGLGLGLDGYIAKSASTRFLYNNDSISFDNDINGIQNKKSKLAVNYFDIPLEIRFKTGNSLNKTFRLAIGAKAGVLFNGHTKIKYTRDSDDETVKMKVADKFALNRFRYGLTARIGYGYFNAFAYYSLSKLFKDDRGPEITPYTFGISVSPNYFIDF